MPFCLLAAALWCVAVWRARYREFADLNVSLPAKRGACVPGFSAAHERAAALHALALLPPWPRARRAVDAERALLQAFDHPEVLRAATSHRPASRPASKAADASPPASEPLRAIVARLWRLVAEEAEEAAADAEGNNASAEAQAARKSESESRSEASATAAAGGDAAAGAGETHADSAQLRARLESIGLGLGGGARSAAAGEPEPESNGDGALARALAAARRRFRVGAVRRLEHARLLLSAVNFFARLRDLLERSCRLPADPRQLRYFYSDAEEDEEDDR